MRSITAGASMAFRLCSIAAIVGTAFAALARRPRRERCRHLRDNAGWAPRQASLSKSVGCMALTLHVSRTRRRRPAHRCSTTAKRMPTSPRHDAPHRAADRGHRLHRVAHLAGAAGSRACRGRRRRLLQQFARGAGARRAAGGPGAGVRARRCLRRGRPCSGSSAGTRPMPWCTSPRARPSANRVARPLAYYANNLGGLFTVCQAMQRHGCRRIVFSSSATVYGVPETAADPRGRRAGRHQPLRPDQADGRDDAARPDGQRPALEGRHAALLQPGGRAPQRPDRRRPARHAEQPDALRGAGGRGAARAPAGVRQRLRHRRRHRRARLHPRQRPGRRPRGRAAPPVRCRPVRSPSTSAPGAATACSRWCRPTRRPAAARSPYGSAPRRPGDVAACYADPTRRASCWAGAPRCDLRAHVRRQLALAAY